MWRCQSPRLSYQILLAIPRMEGVRFNTKFTYLKLEDIIQISGLAEQNNIYCIIQYKCKVHLAKYIYLAIGINSLITLSMGLPLPGSGLRWPSLRWEGVGGWKSAQAHCSPWNSFVSCSHFIGFVALSHLFTPTMLAWLTQGDTPTLLMSSRRNTYSTSWSPQLLIAAYLKERPALAPLCGGNVRFFAAPVLSHTLH